MRPIVWIAATFGVSWLLGGAAVDAHHSFSTEFDANRPVSIEGKVTKVELINPHSWIYVDVTDAQGKVANWAIEGGSPNALVRRGVTKSSVPIGSDLIIEGYQARDGSNRAVGKTLKFADGRPLFFEGTKIPDAASP